MPTSMATSAAPRIKTIPTTCLGVGPISFLLSILIANKERRIDLPQKMRGLPSDIKRPATIIPNVVMRAEQQIPRAIVGERLLDAVSVWVIVATHNFNVLEFLNPWTRVFPHSLPPVSFCA